MRRSLLSLLLLTLVYALVLGSFDPLDLLLGLALSGVLLFVFRDYLFAGAEMNGTLLGRAAAFTPFVLAVLRDVVIGTWEVTLVTLHLRPLKCPGIVAVPIGERTPVGVAVSALVTTLSPGAFLIDVERGVMLLHVIDATDPEAVRERHQEFYRRYQRKVFP